MNTDILIDASAMDADSGQRRRLLSFVNRLAHLVGTAARQIRADREAGRRGCGLRDFLEGQIYAVKLYEKAIREGISRKL